MNFIPLGDHCAPSIVLKNLGVRKSSYPFDWIMTAEEVSESCLFSNISFFKKLIEGKGKNVEEIVRSFMGTFHLLENGQYLNPETQTLFPHENFSGNENIFEKYTRRFERLYQVATSSEPTTYIIISRFVEYPYMFLLDLDRFIHSIHPDNQIIIFTGIPIQYSNTNIVVHHIPYSREDAYNFDYTVFRPKIQEILQKLISEKL